MLKKLFYQRQAFSTKSRKTTTKTAQIVRPQVEIDEARDESDTRTECIIVSNSSPIIVKASVDTTEESRDGASDKENGEKNTTVSPQRRPIQLSLKSKSKWKTVAGEETLKINAVKENQPLPHVLPMAQVFSSASSSPPMRKQTKSGNEFGKLLATQITESFALTLSEEYSSGSISSSGSNVTISPLDKFLFAVEDAVRTRDVSSIMDVGSIVEQFAQGYENMKNSWDRFAVGLHYLTSSGSSITTNWSNDSGEAKFIICRGKCADEFLSEIIESGTSEAAPSIVSSEVSKFDESCSSDIKTEVKAVIDNFFISEARGRLHLI